MMRTIALQLVMTAAFWPALAGANDAVAGVSAGGIVLRKTDAIAMKKEVLNVSNSLISVDYEFLNESAQDVEETIVFPLPAYAVAGQMFDTYYGQPSGFSIKVDGQPVTFTTRLVALLEKKDVTAQLKKIGLSEAQIAYSSHFDYNENPKLVPKMPALTPAQEQQLKKAGLIGELPDGEQGKLWEVQVNYIWKQRFPTRQVVRVHHEYRPFTTGGPGASYIDEDFAKTYCADKDFFAAHKKLSKRLGTDAFPVERVSYILQSGNTWKRGIEDFTLNIIKDSPAALVSLCFPGTFKKVDDKTYRVHLLNFRPTADLEVYFGNVGEHAENNGVMPSLVK